MEVTAVPNNVILQQVARIQISTRASGERQPSTASFLGHVRSTVRVRRLAQVSDRFLNHFKLAFFIAQVCDLTAPARTLGTAVPTFEHVNTSSIGIFYIQSVGSPHLGCTSSSSVQSRRKSIGPRLTSWSSALNSQACRLCFSCSSRDARYTLEWSRPSADPAPQDTSDCTFGARKRPATLYILRVSATRCGIER